MVNKERTPNQPSKRGVLLTRERSDRTRSPKGEGDRRDAQQLAEAVSDAWVELEMGLGANKRKYPLAAFNTLFTAVKVYADATAGQTMIHRSVADCVHDLREYLEGERKRVPGQVLYDADRLECILFAGYDPYFKGNEPPGL